MGIREDQYIGLNDWASHLVSDGHIIGYTDYTRRVYEDKTVEDIETEGTKCLVKREPSGRTFDMFDNEYPLYKYTFPDGKVVQEFLQAEPWSSGPVIFVALEDEAGNPIKESLWIDEEISEYL